jgi:hypothetical protein
VVPAGTTYYCPELVLTVYKTNGDQYSLGMQNTDPTSWIFRFCSTPSFNGACQPPPCLFNGDPSFQYAVAMYRTHTTYAPVQFSQ